MDGIRARRNRPGKRAGEGRLGSGPRPALTFSCNSLALWALFSIPSLCLAGCGLETVTYYSPPSFSYGSNILTLTHNASNSIAFLGYDIYYRAYISQTEADTARQTIEISTGSTSSTPESVLNLMTTNGFKKIYLASNPLTAPTPLLPVTSGTTPSFTILMPRDSQSTNWYYTVSTDSSNNPTQIVRGINLSANNSFNYQYAVNDLDYGSTSGSVTAGGTVNFVFFAVAYGYNFTTLTSIYSFPQSLYSSVPYGSLPTAP